MFCFFTVVLTYLNSKKGWEVDSVLLGYRELGGFEAPDLYECLTKVLEESQLDKSRLVGFTADGASVMGARRALGRASPESCRKVATDGVRVAPVYCHPSGGPRHGGYGFNMFYFRFIKKMFQRSANIPAQQNFCINTCFSTCTWIDEWAVYLATFSRTIENA